MVLTTKYLLVIVLWVGAFFALTSGFQKPLHSIQKPISGRASKTTTSLYDAPEPLAQEDTWQAFLDEETTGLIYYFDITTGESRWEPPTTTFPEVRLPRKKQRIADNLRKEYRRARQEMMDSEESDKASKSEDGGGGFFSSILDNTSKKEEEQLVDSQTQEKEQPTGGWFDNLFNDSGDEGSVEDSAFEKQKIEEESSEGQKDLFGSFFGSTSVEDDVSMEQGAAEEERQQENKNGLFDSFFSSSANANKLDTEVKIVANPLEIEIGAHILPHPEKVSWGGEDATFVKGRTFGVFDGVSGAEKLEGVPLYSRTLADEMKKQCGMSGETVQDMTDYLANAASYADSAATGASTAVVASIGENGFLQALNVGDSCCMIVRNGKVTAKTREISHYWECPYQLSEDSPDQPKDGTKLNVELISGDVVIMGSDGIFDNINDNIILDLVAESSTTKPTPLAKKICDVSREVSLDTTAVTPYAKLAKRRGDADYRDGLGGKVDDVSCIVVACK